MQHKLQDFGPPCEMIHTERKKPQESLKQPSYGPPLVSFIGLQWWKGFFRDDGQSYLVVRKVLHIEQTNTVSLWASGAKDSEKEKEQCVKPSSIKHSLLNSLVPLIPVAPILDLNTLYEQQREQQLAPQLLQFL